MSANASSERDREALRQAHGVRLVTAAEEGVAAADLPVGVYGFTSSPVLASPMFATCRYRNFEVHRLPSGPAVVGFVTPLDADRLSSETDDVIQIELLPEAEGEASTIVAIGYERVVQHRQYSIRTADRISLHVSPAARQFVGT